MLRRCVRVHNVCVHPRGCRCDTLGRPQGFEAVKALASLHLGCPMRNKTPQYCISNDAYNVPSTYSGRKSFG